MTTDIKAPEQQVNREGGGGNTGKTQQATDKGWLRFKTRKLRKLEEIRKKLRKK